MKELLKMLFASAESQEWSWKKIIIWVIMITATIILAMTGYGCKPTQSQVIYEGKILRTDSVMYKSVWNNNSNNTPIKIK